MSLAKETLTKEAGVLTTLSNLAGKAVGGTGRLIDKAREEGLADIDVAKVKERAKEIAQREGKKLMQRTSSELGEVGEAFKAGKKGNKYTPESLRKKKVVRRVQPLSKSEFFTKSMPKKG